MIEGIEGPATSQRRGWRRHRLQTLPLRFRLGVGGVSLTLLAAFVLPPLMTLNPYTMNANMILVHPSLMNPMGTDLYGRSVLARVLVGMQVSYEIGVTVALLTLVAGGVLGLVLGFRSGGLDAVTMRIMDAFMAIPSVMLALAGATVLGPGIANTIIVLSIFFLPRTVRVMRSAVMAVRNAEYLDAARAYGTGPARILFRHVLPNALSPLVIQQTFILAYAVLGEATFSFIGVGTPPPTPSLGNVLTEAQRVIFQAPWLAVFPGVAIALIVVSVNLLGDGIRDLLDVRLRGI